MRILNYLSEHGVDFTVKHHEECFTAQREAEAQHLPGRVFTKTVVVQVDNEFVVLALPASYRVDLTRLEELLGAHPRMATEAEMKELFPDCDVGAEPPFGSLYGMRTIVDEHLANEETIAIRAGNHKEIVLLSYADFSRLEAPRTASFSKTVL